MQLQLANTMTITITPATGNAFVRVAGRLAYLRDHTIAPDDLDAQAKATADVAEALAPFVAGCSAVQLNDHFTVYPRDMVLVVARILSANTHTPRGRVR